MDDIHISGILQAYCGYGQEEGLGMGCTKPPCNKMKGCGQQQGLVLLISTAIEPYRLQTPNILSLCLLPNNVIAVAAVYGAKKTASSSAHDSRGLLNTRD